MKKVMKASKKYIITIACFAVILVACIGATIGITMAYFGDVKSNTATITLGASIYMESSGGVAVAASAATVVPSQPVTVDATATIKAGAGTVTPAVVRAKLTFTAGTTGATFTIEDGTTFDAYLGGTKSSTAVWKAVVNGNNTYLYLVNKTTTTNLEPVNPTTAGYAVKFTVPVTIPSSIGNSASGQACTLAVEFKALQSNIWDASGNAVAKTHAAFASYFDALTAA